MNAQPLGVRVVRCPGCGGDSVYAAANPWRPFCSARCRSNDFGAWASESFAIEAKDGPHDSDPDSLTGP